MTLFDQLKKRIQDQATKTSPEVATRFFKTGPGQYAAHDQFLGLSVPWVRTLSKEFSELCLEDVTRFFYSPINEERLLALFMLVHRYQKADAHEKDDLHTYFKKHMDQVNNWNLVDLSAPPLMGVPLLNENKEILLELVASPNMWRRRVGIVSTFAFIRENQFEWTLRLSTLLLKDPQDLMHKAVGWMLREVGKRDLDTLKGFLEDHLDQMPRTSLRYAIERFPEAERKAYLKR